MPSVSGKDPQFERRDAQRAVSAALNIREEEVVVDGIAVHYRVAGTGRPLLLLHGLLADGQTWRRNLKDLARHSTVYAVDLFNMGKSQRVAGLDASLEATADRIARLMDSLGLDEADIAGHSHGGALAMMLAARHTHRVGKLVLFAPANPFCGHGARNARFFATPLGAWLGRRVPQWPGLLHRAALRRMYGEPSRIIDGTLACYTEHLSIPGTMDHLLAIVRSWGSDMRRLKKVMNQLADVPALLIWGDRDRAVSLPSAQLLAKEMHHAELLVLHGVGHLPFEEQPEVCNRAIARWLQN
ncbi:alpha/beta fold hydrolase [Terriglobus albidus]|uniref:Alpha/beta fold hydrolase n=1 Tax=Terriglobus albidus TaxID=1592106 RepID=A0A5B9E3Z0_9BACT|nr:alpha/beta fold hydrolase [Terriglobus albidus]